MSAPIVFIWRDEQRLIPVDHFRPHDDPNFVNTKSYLPPELQIAPPKKANSVGATTVVSGLVKTATVKSFAGANNRGKPGRRGRPSKQDVSCDRSRLFSQFVLRFVLMNPRMIWTVMKKLRRMITPFCSLPSLPVLRPLIEIC